MWVSGSRLSGTGSYELTGPCVTTGSYCAAINAVKPLGGRDHRGLVTTGNLRNGESWEEGKGPPSVGFLCVLSLFACLHFAPFTNLTKKLMPGVYLPNSS